MLSCLAAWFTERRRAGHAGSAAVSMSRKNGRRNESPAVEWSHQIFSSEALAYKPLQRSMQFKSSKATFKRSTKFSSAARIHLRGS